MNARDRECGMRCRQLPAALLSLLCVSGCAIVVPAPPAGREYLKGHYILAHEDGYPLSVDISPFREKLDPAKNREDIEKRILLAIDAHARRLWSTAPAGPAPEPLRTLLFVHGGLNGYQADFSRMREMLARPEDCERGGPPERLFVSQACNWAKTEFYPIFLNWNSGLLDSIADDLFFIRFGRRMQRLHERILGVVTTPFVAGGRLAESVFSAPNGWWTNYRNFLDGDPGPGDWIEGLAMTPIRILTIPVLKAFGTSAWQIMKRRADLLVAERLDPAPRGKRRAATGEARAGQQEPEVPREGAARALLQMLNTRLTHLPDGSARWNIGKGGASGSGPVEITVVGHSMGAIVLNRLVASLPEFPISRIVYLAPAASKDETEGLVGPHLRTTRGATADRAGFWTFELNHRDEARERDPSRLLPRGTLLVWIDSFFEPIGQPGDKRYGRYKTHLDYYGEGKLPASLNICEVAEDSPSHPRRHGQIDDKEYLEAVLWRVAQDAFQKDAIAPRKQLKCTGDLP